MHTPHIFSTNSLPSTFQLLSFSLQNSTNPNTPPYSSFKIQNTSIQACLNELRSW
ncbi:hypothetical protein HanXRQr2_Chr03g0108281 [Helianthus annuus]|nr:hypothetical protein HanXRQr2_Chr03g0108281 [Helianthus annuus]KAJ0943452.1 hypothetical protein HanPSC8_Chr03g0104781 [Helianthus annuus]